MLASFQITRALLVSIFAISVVSASSNHGSSHAHRRHHQRHAIRKANTTTTDECEEEPSTTSSAVPTPSASLNPSKGGKTNATGEYSVVDRWAGADFFNGWNFFSNPDPTHGLVNYLPESEAKSSNLAYVDGDGNAVMKVDSTTDLPLGKNRDSVRIATQKRYDGGLFVLDLDTMPYGFATWPAFWTVGTDWPNHGEIDIVEGVHNNNQNQYTLHTAPGCTTDTSNTAPAAFSIKNLSSKVTSSVCGSSKTSNSGCAFVDSSTESYGAKLNAAGGAVFAMLWTDEGLKIWNFPRGDIPDDLTAQNPSPSSWGNQYLKAAWAASTCSTKQYFKQHAITINTSLCGDWAGASYKSAGGPGTCQERVMKGSNFDTAVWKIKSVTVYQ